MSLQQVAPQKFALYIGLLCASVPTRTSTLKSRVFGKLTLCVKKILCYQNLSVVHHKARLEPYQSVSKSGGSPTRSGTCRDTPDRRTPSAPAFLLGTKWKIEGEEESNFKVCRRGSTSEKIFLFIRKERAFDITTTLLPYHHFPPLPQRLQVLAP